MMMLTTVRSARASAASRRAAFTLLEVLIVVAILVILASAASIAYFRYLEDAKIGRAQSDMRILEQAFKKYYGEHEGMWPQQLTDIAPQLDQGEAGLLDPWGQPYSFEIAQGVPQADGSTTERPIFYCQPPNGRDRIQWPKK